MSIHTAKPQLSFQLPSLSYIDAKWEEPALHAPTVPVEPARRGGLAAWLSRHLASFVAWRRDRAAEAELASMSDRELMDIGISRSDLPRLFDDALNQDLRHRGTYA